MLTIRLARIGKKKKPFYRVVVIERTRARDGPRARSGWNLRSIEEARGSKAGFRTNQVLARRRGATERYRAQLH